MGQTRYKLTLKPLTYIHIGASDELDPTQYVIRDGHLYILNQSKFIKYLHRENPDILQQVISFNFDQIAQYFSKSFDPSQRDTWIQKHPVHDVIAKKYFENLDKRSTQLMISSFIRNSFTGNPYIPGSSIKGAIRTALLDMSLRANPHSQIQRYQGNVSDRDLEAKQFGYMTTDKYGRTKADITRDPFKYIKISDAEFTMDNLVLFSVNNVKNSVQAESTRKHKGGELNYLCQAIKRDAGHIVLTMSVDSKWYENSHQNVQAVFSACSEYYVRKFEADGNFHQDEARKNYHSALLKLLKHKTDNEFILRLGRGTGSIFTSINLQNPSTRNLINNLPMGLSKITFEEL